MSKQPNLIYVFADQLRYSAVGYNGDEYAYTPNIDALSNDSTIIDNAISGHPVCAPYRASLLTGKYTTSTGMVINEIRLNPNHKSFAHVLNDAGYFTEYMGKWHLYAAQLGHHYDANNSFIPPGENRLGFQRFTGYNFHHQYYAPFAYHHEETIDKIYEEGYEPDAQTDAAIKRLETLSKGDKPFAFFLSIGTPHDPWTPDNVPEEFYKKFKDINFEKAPNYKPFNDLRGDFPWTHFLPGERSKLNDWKKVYYAMVANLDYNIGRLVDAINNMGLDRDTIFVFTTDHGELFGAHGRHGKNIFYEEAIHVPFLIKYDKLPKGKYEGMLNTVDIMPTLLSLMGLEAPNEAQGRDISNDISSMKKPNDLDGVLLQGTGPTAIYGNGFEWRGYRTPRYKYAIYRRGHKELLFDLANDPFEKVNLVKDRNYGEVLQTLRQKMKDEMDRIGDDFEKNSFYKKYWVTDRKINEHLPRRSEIKKG